MNRIAKFEKVSKEAFVSAYDEIWSDQEGSKWYDALKLPKRGTAGSAGYDFFAPHSFTLLPNETIKIPTGIRARMRNDYVLCIFPRSSLGFKYRLQLNNTVGIIDSDYYFSDNEGHIFIKITNDTNESKVIEIQAGSGFAQGIFFMYGICEDDEETSVRNGGFGSTNQI